MSDLVRLARYWWTFDQPVRPRDYLRHGLALTAVKYAGDVTLVYLGADRFWTPLDYLRSVPPIENEVVVFPERVKPKPAE